MFVFIPSGSEQSFKLEKGSEPTSHDLAFINPREEDPMNFLLLDLETLQFEAHANHPIASRGFTKVVNTVEILGLNDRALAHHRNNATRYYKGLLIEYVAAKKCENFEELIGAIHGRPKLDLSKSFLEEKNRILNGITKAMFGGDHPTVWREMIRQQHLLPDEIKALFAQAPELTTKVLQ